MRAREERGKRRRSVGGGGGGSRDRERSATRGGAWEDRGRTVVAPCVVVERGRAKEHATIFCTRGTLHFEMSALTAGATWSMLIGGGIRDSV